MGASFNGGKRGWKIKREKANNKNRDTHFTMTQPLRFSLTESEKEFNYFQSFPIS